jgi:hypothetical protein
MITAQVLAGPAPKTNFARKYYWRHRYFKATGVMPTPERWTWVRCSVCRVGFQIPVRFIKGRLPVTIDFKCATHARAS